MKKLFVAPEVEVVTFDTKDVITTSGCPTDSCVFDDITVCINDICPEIDQPMTCDDWIE